MKRTKLANRMLPTYSRGEEQMNTVTHIIGGVLSVAGLVLMVIHTAFQRNPWSITASTIYGVALVAVFTISSVYHGLTTDFSKKVMQVIDHCTIYFLIAGTYTVIVLCALRPAYPGLGWGMFAFQWVTAAVAVTLTAIDLKRFEVFSMVCYIGMGWAVIPFWRQVLEVMSVPGFTLLLLGGIAYTIGSILYGLGSRKKWMHCVFHIFVILGAFLQFLAVLFYVI